MTLFKTLVSVIDGIAQQDGLLDTVSVDGALWLVPRWRLGATEGQRTPKIAIRLSSLDYRRASEPSMGADFVLDDPIPSGILDGTADLTELSGYDVVAALPVEIPIPTKN